MSPISDQQIYIDEFESSCHRGYRADAQSKGAELSILFRRHRFRTYFEPKAAPAGLNPAIAGSRRRGHCMRFGFHFITSPFSFGTGIVVLKEGRARSRQAA
jgi:hypothetical protein